MQENQHKKRNTRSILITFGPVTNYTRLSVSFSDGSKQVTNPTKEFLMAAFKNKQMWSDLAIELSQGKDIIIARVD